MTITPKDLAGRTLAQRALLPEDGSPIVPDYSFGRHPFEQDRRRGDRRAVLSPFTYRTPGADHHGMTLHLTTRRNPRDFTFLTPTAARRLADRLHDMADRADSKKESGR